jgi:hypothetical protein
VCILQGIGISGMVIVTYAMVGDGQLFNLMKLVKYVKSLLILIAVGLDMNSPYLPHLGLDAYVVNKNHEHCA